MSDLLTSRPVPPRSFPAAAIVLALSVTLTGSLAETAGAGDRPEASPAAAASPATGESSKAPQDAGAKRDDAVAVKPMTSAEAAAAETRLHRDLDWNYCGPRPPALGPAPVPPSPGDREPIQISADAAEYDQAAELALLRGDVEIRRAGQTIESADASYNQGTGEAETTGGTFLEHPGLRVAGSRAQFNLGTDQGSVWNAHYRLTGPSNAHGSADRALIFSRDLTRFDQITYTTCPPTSNAWALRATKLDIDRSQGWGTARNATLRVRDIPVLYTPYVSFPIDDRRKSGFLVPTIGVANNNGLDLTLPYYFNIAPNLDATVAPRVMTQRGLMLGGELRFLTPSQRGALEGQIIPNDAHSGDNATRWAVHAEQLGRLGPRWSTAVNFNSVSDATYLADFGNRLETTSVRNLEQRGDLTYSGKGWSLLSRVQRFETVDETIPAASRPYARLPQLLWTALPWTAANEVQAGADAEYDYFDHSTKVHGQRVAVAPWVSWPLRKPYGYLIPRVKLRAAAYALTDQTESLPADPAYAIPTASLDGKLIFERSLDWFGKPSLQTLEPRAFYLYTPYQDQSDAPTFDTTPLDFSFASLFRDNRFTGRDRIGDANQLTLGLTSRTLDEGGGRELFSVSVGQVLFFEDRQVQISTPTQDTQTSSVAGELAARLLTNWSGRASFQYNPNTDADPWERRVLQLHYQTPDAHLVNLAYRYNLGASIQDRYEDTDLTFLLPVGKRVKLVGRWLYSLLYDETMDAFAGIEFGQCCWRMRLLARNYKNGPDSNGTTSVMFQVELAGLGKFGESIDKFLERGIYGYHTD
jgi:LPS-assembly protein